MHFVLELAFIVIEITEIISKKIKVIGKSKEEIILLTGLIYVDEHHMSISVNPLQKTVTVFHYKIVVQEMVDFEEH